MTNADYITLALGAVLLVTLLAPSVSKWLKKRKYDHGCKITVRHDFYFRGHRFEGITKEEAENMHEDSATMLDSMSAKVKSL